MPASKPLSAAVVPEGLNLRRGPGVSHRVIGVLTRGQAVRVTASRGARRHVETSIDPGVVHGGYLTSAAGAESVEGATYTVRRGDSLSAIGRALGVGWRGLALANRIVAPYVIRVGQVLRRPGPVARVGGTGVGDPLAMAGRTVLTSSSANGHHRPHGGSRPADLDIEGESRGEPVRFDVQSTAGELRGVVMAVDPACRSGAVADGGYKAQLRPRVA